MCLKIHRRWVGKKGLDHSVFYHCFFCLFVFKPPTTLARQPTPHSRVQRPRRHHEHAGVGRRSLRQHQRLPTDGLRSPGRKGASAQRRPAHQPHHAAVPGRPCHHQAWPPLPGEHPGKTGGLCVAPQIMTGNGCVENQMAAWTPNQCNKQDWINDMDLYIYIFFGLQEKEFGTLFITTEQHLRDFSPYNKNKCFFCFVIVLIFYFAGTFQVFNFFFLAPSWLSMFSIMFVFFFFKHCWCAFYRRSH